MTVEEYQVGQLWSVAEASKAETGGGEGVEVLKNEPFDGVPLLNGQYSKGQYTHKIYHLQSKVPTIIRKIAPKGSLAIHEEAWNAYPYCRTILTAHSLAIDELAKRDVVHINIANDHEFLHSADVQPDTTPGTFSSVKTGRGPLNGNWREVAQPVMCAYKLVTVHFKWFGLQKVVESYIHTQYPRLFSKFHREVFCWIDKWHGLTMDDIRAIEAKAQKELEDQIRNGQPFEQAELHVSSLNVHSLGESTYSGGHVLKAPPRSASMTYVTNYVINLSDSKVERGRRRTYFFPSDSKRLNFDSSENTTLVQSAAGHVKCSCVNATRALRFFKETKGLFRATHSFNPDSTKRCRIDLTLSEHSGYAFTSL
uniref:Phosphatidylinositol transfer protein beta n=1 Tax=Heterorhabditis bacteriophora TaxID=37862 RepID=A0A1I7XJR2_HETBA